MYTFIGILSQQVVRIMDTVSLLFMQYVSHNTYLRKKMVSCAYGRPEGRKAEKFVPLDSS
jgi:hypothetical protein